MAKCVPSTLLFLTSSTSALMGLRIGRHASKLAFNHNCSSQKRLKSDKFPFVWMFYRAVTPSPKDS